MPRGAEYMDVREAPRRLGAEYMDVREAPRRLGAECGVPHGRRPVYRFMRARPCRRSADSRLRTPELDSPTRCAVSLIVPHSR
jgi:hypothetical protein